MVASTREPPMTLNDLKALIERQAEALKVAEGALQGLVIWSTFRSDYVVAGHAGEEPSDQPLVAARLTLAKIRNAR